MGDKEAAGEDVRRFDLPAPREAGVRVVRLPNGHSAILLDVATVYGQATYYLDESRAEILGKGLQDAARVARSGIITAGPGTRLLGSD